MHIFVYILFVLMSVVSPALSWDSVEMEVFDVVEEVNQNFYELMGLTQDATLTDVKRAYRTLSKQIHPDKSDAPDADIKFRQMVAVYEVLKDPERRGHYDRVLVEGLPDWRSAVYYYRRARKMSMLEISFILTVVISISQYLMAWGSYFDQWKTMEEALSRKYRKGRRKAGEADPVQEELATLPKPSMLNILPVQVCRTVVFLVLNGPSLWRQYQEDRRRRCEEELAEKKIEEEEQLQREKEEEERLARKAAPKRRKQVVVEEVKGERRPAAAPQWGTDFNQEPAAAGYNTGMWTDEEFCELTKLMNKYPGGTIDRWDVIAEQLNRPPHEVTKMAAKMRDRLAAGAWLQQQEEAVQLKLKTKTRASAVPDAAVSTAGDCHWSAVQQRALERALKAHPKGSDQRWERIGKQVPEKTAEDCVNRFKFLAERIRKKKEEEAAKAGGDEKEEGDAADGGGGDEHSGEEQDGDCQDGEESNYNGSDEADR